MDEELKRLLGQPIVETAPLNAEQEAMVRRHIEAVEAAREMADWFGPRPPVGPFTGEPYNAVRGMSWTISDSKGNHIATVFEEPAARLILQRLNA